MGLSLLWGCGPQQHVEDTRRAVGSPSPAIFLQPMRESEPNPLNWVDAAQEEVYPDLDPTWKHPSYLADSDPRTLRLQFWMDALYQLLYEQTPTAFERDGWTLPKPRIRIMEEPSLNAFSSSRSVCYRSSLHLEGVTATNVSNARVLLLSPRGSLGVYRRDQSHCIDRTDQPVPAALVAAYIRTNIQPTHCSFREEAGTLIFGADCRLGGSTPDAQPEIIQLESVSPWITLTTGVITHFESEAATLLTLTHELAHYFSAHGALFKPRVQYFYRQNEDNLKRPRPEPAPELAALGESLLKLPAFRTQEISGQHYHSEMFSYFRTALPRLIEPACQGADSPCFVACKDLITLGREPSFQKHLERFPQAQLKDQALLQYQQYETFFARCSEAITVSDQTPGALGTVPSETVRLIYWKSSRDDTTEGKPFSVAVEAMSQKLFAEAAERDIPMRKALDERLGYYTTEEEADMFALQGLAMLGIDPAIGRSYWLEFMRQSQEQDSALSFAYDRCKAVYDADPRWSVGGVAVPIPIGSFADPHHSKCFRLYKTDQRLEALDFPLGPDLQAKAERVGGPWQSLWPR